MNLKTKLGDDLKAAMRERDTVRLDAIRSIRAAITQREVDTQKELGDDAVLDIIRTLRKQRLESIEQYQQGGRDDLAAKELREKELLESYLPQAPDLATIEHMVRSCIAECGATSVRDMGKVMQLAREKLAGADGKLLSDVVKRLLVSAQENASQE